MPDHEWPQEESGTNAVQVPKIGSSIGGQFEYVHHNGRERLGAYVRSFDQAVREKKRSHEWTDAAQQR